MISIPNGQISNDRLEDLSCRDKFWLHPILSLQYETTAAQMRSALDSIRRLLLDHACVEQDSIRVRFLGFGSSSLDVEVFAYIPAVDFADFLAIQEELLLQVYGRHPGSRNSHGSPVPNNLPGAGAGQERAGVPEIQKIPIRNEL